MKNNTLINQPIDYILFQLKTQNEQNDNLNDLIIKQYLEEKFKQKYLVIYPTHDNKVYLSSIDKNSLLKLVDQVITIEDKFKLIKCDYLKDNGFSLYGYYAIKPTVLPNLPTYEEKFKYFLKTFGVEIKLFEKNYMIKADEYQKNLIDFYLKQTQSSKDNTSTSLFKHFYKEKNIELEICQEDLLDQNVDIIVNAANTRLLLGGGIAGAIRNRCGPIVQKECTDYLNRRGSLMNISEVMHTSSKNIHAKYIIHACGPRWDDYSDINKTECYNDLKQTFLNILNYSDKKLFKSNSIAIPLISSGIFGVPKILCCKALFYAIKEYIYEMDDSKKCLKFIKLVNIDFETSKVVLDYFRENFKLEDQTSQISKDNNESQINNEQLKCVICDSFFDSSKLISLNCKCSYCKECLENVEQNNSKCIKCETIE